MGWGCTRCHSAVERPWDSEPSVSPRTPMAPGMLMVLGAPPSPWTPTVHGIPTARGIPIAPGTLVSPRTSMVYGIPTARGTPVVPGTPMVCSTPTSPGTLWYPRPPLRRLGPSWHPGPPMAPTIPMSPGTPAVAGSPVAPGTRGDTWDPSWPPAPLLGPTVAPPWPPAPIAGPSAPDGTWWEGGGGQREFQSQPPPPPFGGVPWLLLHPTALLSCRGGCAAAWGLHPCMGEVVPLHGRGEGLRASTLGGGGALPHGGLHSPLGAALQRACMAPLCCSQCLWCRETLGGS